MIIYVCINGVQYYHIFRHIRHLSEHVSVNPYESPLNAMFNPIESHSNPTKEPLNPYKIPTTSKSGKSPSDSARRWKQFPSFPEIAWTLDLPLEFTSRVVGTFLLKKNKRFYNFSMTICVYIYILIYINIYIYIKTHVYLSICIYNIYVYIYIFILFYSLCFHEGFPKWRYPASFNFIGFYTRNRPFLGTPF